MKALKRHLIVSLIFATTTCVTDVVRADNDDLAYKQINLVSDGAASAVTPDSQLKNPWGIATLPGAPFWIADNGTGVSTLYDGHGNIVPLTVKIPAPKGVPDGSKATPTGIVWNPNGQLFLVKPQLAALFIFATEDGTISAWNPNVDLHNAILEADESQIGAGAVYKGLALATNSTGVFLYATNFRTGTVDVFDSSFKPAKLSGSFSDRTIPEGYAPFGIALIDGNLFVTYAKQDAQRHDDMKGPGRGFVNVFDTDGKLVTRFASRGTLNSPWGIARAPLNFGPFSTRVLIGNFGDGRISGFTSGGDFRGQLRGTNGHAIRIDGLWSIVFSTQAAADPNKLYFTAGLNDEADGLFGSLEVIAAPDRDRDDH
ncbi:MAG: TIGR03118 family protein [Steroidobacteraceae bacterium]